MQKNTSKNMSYGIENEFEKNVHFKHLRVWVSVNMCELWLFKRFFFKYWFLMRVILFYQINLSSAGWLVNFSDSDWVMGLLERSVVAQELQLLWRHVAQFCGRLHWIRCDHQQRSLQCGLSLYFQRDDKTKLLLLFYVRKY